MILDRKCPLCDKPLLRQSAQDAGGYEPDIYCSEEIILPEDNRAVSHYRESSMLEESVTMFIPPYRIVTQNGMSKIGVRRRFKTRRGVVTNKGLLFFKTLIKCPPIHPDTESKLRDRIKLLLIMS